MAFWQWMGLAVAAAALCMVVRTQQPELAGLCALAAGTMLLSAALESVTQTRAMLTRLTALGGLNDAYLSTLLKVLGVSCVSELAAQACEDMGESGLALKVGFVGKLFVFSLTVPLLLDLLEMILELVP